MDDLTLLDLPKSAIAPEKLPTNLTTWNHAIHRWMNFTAGYSPEFVLECLKREHIAEGLVLDPFAGMGTTLVAANSAGVAAVGFDPHPHAAMMSRAKVQTRSPESVERVGRLLATLTPSLEYDDLWNEGQIKFLEKLIDVEQLKLLASARRIEAQVTPEDLPIFRLIVTRLLESASGASTDGIYKAPTSKKRARPISETLPRVLADLREDLRLVDENWGESTIVEHSSETMAEVASESVSQVITSPPYLNNFDFAEMTRMELYYWGYASSWGDITEKVRTKLVVNTTTAPTPYKKAQDAWRGKLSEAVSQSCQTYVDELVEARAEKSGSKDYERLVFPYFAQIQAVIKECYRVLKSGSTLDLVVSDAALYGVHIHTEEVIKEVMLEAGFTSVEIVRLRSRGHRWVLAKRTGSKDPLGEFHLIARKS